MRYPSATSPASERLDRCIFYLDEIHTRGTDFKFPVGFKAAVTLGINLTKDRFVQACMRMRKLGSGHSLTFWSSNEVHQQIETLKNKTLHINHKRRKGDGRNTLIDILRWVYDNTEKATWGGLHYWATQSLSFQRKVSAFQSIDWNNNQQQFSDKLMKDSAMGCLEPQVIELKLMYEAAKTLQTLLEIHDLRYQHTSYQVCNDIRGAVLNRLKVYGGTKQRLSQLLDGEQQRELEQELEEERQIELSPPFNPCKPILHEEIKRLCDMDDVAMNLKQYPHIFRHLPYALTGTTFFSDCQADSWQKNLWVLTEFQRVISTQGKSLNPFLRPLRWILIYRNQELILLSPFEANWVMGRLSELHRKGKLMNPVSTTLCLLLPRMKRNQFIFINTPTLTVPPLVGLPRHTVEFVTSNDCLVQLFIFNGTLYFESIDEQTAYCQCLILCPKPRSEQEEKLLNKAGLEQMNLSANIYIVSI
ncbi:unnamed protein product [Rotaria sp. Silwood1]|nr:unnamed protein product [Rotaria sp. Silwood1]CAF3721632.1 unnamed protein product [Rotaria sp. Silwood1]CAF3749049.1 unnamed protein product [Rotaria sp. Silwood1]CAF3755691.1 unnamed protein product [Rotaria sp. Silwood1]CAF3804514.1 unnamed protein product [Rotaria sp. Silwood1]